MKVKVRSKVYDSENEPVMVILSPGEKDQIANMGDARKYCVYPAIEHWTKDNFKNIKKWMAEE